MAAIRGRDTKPELLIRSGLHRLGYRFRVSRRDMPGKPDLVFKRFNAVILVHGCFWHGHNCRLFRLPATRTEFWSAKINGNRDRDASVKLALADLGWRQATVWACALNGKGRLELPEVFARLTKWLEGTDNILEIEGRP